MGEHGMNLPCKGPQDSRKLENYAEVKQIVLAVYYNFILHKVKPHFVKLALFVALE